MQKRHRDLLKMLKAEADKLGVTMGKMVPLGSSHFKVPCTRPDGTTFSLTLANSSSDKHAALNTVSDLRRSAKKVR